MVDATKINYYSGWDIDQVINQGSVSVAAGDSTIFNNTSLPNVFEVEFQPTGSIYWYQAGKSSTNGTSAGTFTFFTYLSGVSLHINTTTGGTARYYVWSDKVNY